MVAQALFYILLALRDGERHGYRILKDVHSDSKGRVRFGPATMYTSLKKLLDAGLVQEVTGPRDADPRRRYYRLTSAGRSVLSEELDRMQTAVALARPQAARVRA